jgi:hypothetical protein
LIGVGDICWPPFLLTVRMRPVEMSQSAEDVLGCDCPEREDVDWGNRLLAQRTDCLGLLGQPNKFALGPQRLSHARRPPSASKLFWGD